MSEISLPKGWVKCLLGSVIELKYGKPLPAKFRNGGQYPVYGSNGIIGTHSEPLVETAGLIVGRKGSYGEVHISEEPFFPIDTTYFVDDLSGQSLKYWFYQLTFLPLTKLNRSTTIPGLNRNDAYRQTVVLPPLAEQIVIADRLDNLLAQVSSIKARLENIPNILKHFRQVMLDTEISGRSATEKHAGNTKSWNEYSLKEVTAKIGSGATPKGGSNAYKPNGIPLVRSMNIHTNFIKYDELAFIDDEQAEKLSGATIEKDDILLNITGASIGRVNIAPESFVGGRVNQHVAIIRCIPEKVLPKFLYLYLASPEIQEWIDGENYGATRQALTKLMIEELIVRLPSIEEQIAIICSIEQVFAYTDTLERQVQAALTRVSNLTQSIISKALQGELTSDWRIANPKLISGDNRAEVLLEKIKLELELIQEKRKQSVPLKRVSMKKITKEDIKNWVTSRKENFFTFETLNASFGIDYEELKECLFEALSEENALFQQVFDDVNGRISFSKVEV